MMVTWVFMVGWRAVDEMRKPHSRATLTDPIPDPPAISTPSMPQSTSPFNQVTLYTGSDGRARFRDEMLEYTEGTPQALLTRLMPSGGMQLRHSPVGFRSNFHCTTTPQWVFILGGEMEILLQDGSSRIFRPGEHFYSADTLPPGATFDPGVHGHWSRQNGSQPLVTLFVRS
jgi:hypothetical protein